MYGCSSYNNFYEFHSSDIVYEAAQDLTRKLKFEDLPPTVLQDVTYYQAIDES